MAPDIVPALPSLWLRPSVPSRTWRIYPGAANVVGGVFIKGDQGGGNRVREVLVEGLVIDRHTGVRQFGREVEHIVVVGVSRATTVPLGEL